MERRDMRVSRPRWRTLGSAALALAAVAVIGLTTVAPARADWRDRGWHERPSVGFGLSFGAPAYGYSPYPAYGYSPYYYGYSPYYYGYPYGGPSIGFEFGRR